MSGTVLRKVQPNKAVDLADPQVLANARHQCEIRDQIIRLETRALFLRRKASRLPKGSNGRDKAQRDAKVCDLQVRELRNA